MYYDSYLRTFHGRISSVIIVLFFFAGANPCIAASRGAHVPVRQFNEASDCILEGQYEKAESVFTRFMKEHPDEPAGPLMKAAVMHYHCIDYNDFSRSKEFFSLLDRAERLALQKTDEDSADEWAQYYRHSAGLLRAARLVARGKIIKGIIKGQSGIRGLSQLVSENGDFYDAYLMTGSYRFLKSEAMKSFHWLPFIEDQREKGITEVREAIARGKMTGPLSWIVLIEMFSEYDPELAVEHASELSERYPSCRLFRWQLGESLKRTGHYEEAVHVLTVLAKEMANDPEDDGSGPLRCWWKLAVLAESLGKNEECLHFCEEIIRIGQKKSVYDRQKKRIEGARKLIGKIKDE